MAVRHVELQCDDHPHRCDGQLLSSHVCCGVLASAGEKECREVFVGFTYEKIEEK